MSRPVDCQIDRIGSLCTPFSPRDVVLSGWMGDDDATFNGLRGCMKKVIYSAWDGYTNFGCDIGGYRGEDVSSKQVRFHLSTNLFTSLAFYSLGSIWCVSPINGEWWRWRAQTMGFRRRNDEHLSCFCQRTLPSDSLPADQW